jgi:hypothetical protein
MKILNVQLNYNAKYSIMIQDETEVKTILAKLIVNGYSVTGYSIDKQGDN